MVEPGLGGLHDLTLGKVRRLLYPSVFRQAEACYREGVVSQARRRGRALEASVYDQVSHAVRIAIKSGALAATCTCPFAQTAFCRHVGAVLLQWIRKPESFAAGSSRPAWSTEQPLPPERAVQEQVALNAQGQDERRPSPHDDAAGASEQGSSLRDLLRQLPLDHLRRISRQRGWSMEANDKEAYVSAIAPLLSDATSVARAVLSLPDGLRQALRAAFVIEDGHGVTPEELARVLTALRDEEGPRVKAVEAAGLLADLAGHGLVLPWDSSPGAATYLLPWEIQARVPPLPGWCRPAAQLPAKPAGGTEDLAFLEILGRVWQQIASEPPVLRRSLEPEPDLGPARRAQGWHSHHRETQAWKEQPKGSDRRPQRLPIPAPHMLLDDAHVERLTELTHVEPEKLEFALHLLIDLHLARAEADLLIADPDAMERFSRYPLIRQKRAAAQAYVSMLSWSELDTLMRTEPDWELTRSPYLPVSLGQFRSELARARQMVLRFLATAGEGRTCPLSCFETALLHIWPDFFRLRRTRDAHLVPASLHLSTGQSAGGTPSNGYPPQAAFLRTMLTGPLNWLGYAKAISADRDTVAIQTFGLAELLWRPPSEAGRSSPVGRPVDYAPSTGTVKVLLHAVDPQVPTFLAQLCALESADGEQLVFRLDMRTVHAAFERGKLLEEIQMQWRETMPLPMPESFDSTLREWWGRYGSVRLYDGFALLELDDHVTLRELEATTSLAQHIVAKVSPRMVLVPEAQVDDLVRQLQARGHMPRQVA